MRSTGPHVQGSGRSGPIAPAESHRQPPPGGEACVCDISGTFDLSQPTISHHLKTLRSAGLLDSQRRGSWVYYRVIPAALQQLSTILHIDDGDAAPITVMQRGDTAMSTPRHHRGPPRSRQKSYPRWIDCCRSGSAWP